MSIQRPEALDRIAAALGDRVVVHVERGRITATCARITVQGDTPEAACDALLPELRQFALTLAESAERDAERFVERAARRAERAARLRGAL